MNKRKAGDSLLKQAYLAALAQEGRAPGSLGADAMALERMLADQGSAALGTSDLRALLNDAASPRKTAEMNPAEKLGVIERYLQDQFGGMAPMLLPVQDRAGVYGASVIDGDRMVVHGLEGAGSESELAFAPAAASGLVHVIENAPMDRGGIQTYGGAMSADTARKLYAAAQSEGYGKVDGVLEGWAMGTGVSAEAGPAVQRLFQRLQQRQPAVNQQQSAAPFQIVASRGPGARFDVLGMRQNGRVMHTVPVEEGGDPRFTGVSSPGEPGWLGNPFVANDAGGRMTRAQATAAFGKLVDLKAQDPAWRQAFLDLRGKRIGYYKPDEQAIHLHALQDWITRNAGT
jgi:hypothetical protein